MKEMYGEMIFLKALLIKNYHLQVHILLLEESSLGECSELCLRGATQQWLADALPYFACDLELLI